jgi:hypothetical protein
LKRKLEEKYCDDIFFSEVCGRKNVICFQNMASRLINEKWYADRSCNVADESIRIVTAAAKLIQAQIRESMYTVDEYPLTNDLCNITNAKGWVPSLLMTFMSNVVKDELKQVSISHSIVQATRPRSSISPILFGIGVSLDHMFGSRTVIDMLARVGFSISHDEVGRYKQSVVQSNNPDVPQSYSHSFTQWSGDNVDHNVKTLDGTGTFHGMGIISMTTPCTSLAPGGSFTESSVQRLKH